MYLVNVSHRLKGIFVEECHTILITEYGKSPKRSSTVVRGQRFLTNFAVSYTELSFPKFAGIKLLNPTIDDPTGKSLISSFSRPMGGTMKVT